MKEIIIPSALQSAVNAGQSDDRLLRLAPGETLGEKYAYIALAKKEKENTRVEYTDPSEYVTSAECAEGTDPCEGKQTTIVMSDLHIPYQRDDLVLDIAQRHEGARLVLAGDIFNNASYTEWPRLNMLNSRVPEYAYRRVDILDIGLSLLEKIAPYFIDVKILRGNHDAWISKSEAKATGGDTSATDRQFEQLFESLPNVVVPKRTIRDYSMLKRGDAWIGHFLSYGRTPNRGAIGACDWMLENIEIEKMGDWKVLVQAHTHRLSDSVYKRKWVMESGALCKRPDYQDSKPGKGDGRSPELGYIILTQYDGVTSKFESGLVRYNDDAYFRYLTIGPYSGEPVYGEYL